MDSSVFLNGEQVGGRLYGYSNFFVDITGNLNEGSNELKVIYITWMSTFSDWNNMVNAWRQWMWIFKIEVNRLSTYATARL